MRYVRSESSMNGTGSELFTGYPRVIDYVGTPISQLLNPTSRSPLSAAS